VSHFRFSTVIFEVPPRKIRSLWYSMWLILPDNWTVFHKSSSTETSRSFKSEETKAKQWNLSIYVKVKHEEILKDSNRLTEFLTFPVLSNIAKVFSSQAAYRLY
jgi:hypothetical protein